MRSSRKNKVPGNWVDFLHECENKKQLFSFLSSKLATMECVEGKYLVTTAGMSVASTGVSHNMQACNHEEADTRMLVHLQDALDNGATTCLVRKVDTDVVVIFVGSLLERHPAANIWLALN